MRKIDKYFGIIKSHLKKIKENKATKFTLKHLKVIREHKITENALKCLKFIFSIFRKLEELQIRREHGINENFLIFRKSIKVLLYRLSVYALLIFIICYFKTDVVYISEVFFNLFRIKKIFRLDSFSTLILIKAVNILGLVAILAIIISALLDCIKWVSGKIILLNKELILEEGSILKSKSVRILKKDIKSISIEKSLIETVFRTGKISFFTNRDKNSITISGLAGMPKLYRMLNK